VKSLFSISLGLENGVCLFNRFSSRLHTPQLKPYSPFPSSLTLRRDKLEKIFLFIMIYFLYDGSSTFRYFEPIKFSPISRGVDSEGIGVCYCNS